MGIEELEKELQKAVSNYAYDVQYLLTENTELLENESHRQILQLIDEMNRRNFYAIGSIKDSIIKYLKENK